MFAAIKQHSAIALQTLRLQFMDLMEDRVFFVAVVVGSIANIFLNVVLFQAIWGQIDTLAGWSLAQAYVLLGTWHLIEQLSWMSYLRGFNRVSAWVRDGEFDRFLVIPLKTKTFISYRFANVTFSLPALVTACLLISYGVSQSDTTLNLVGYAVLLLCGLAINYSIRAIVAAISITNPVEAPFYLTSELMHLGQYPLQIYRGLMKQVLTFLVPVGIMVTVPVRTLFGAATWLEIIAMVAVAAFFYVFSNWLFNLQLRRYESSHG